MSVALVLVAHSSRLAEGTVELARQMAPDVVLRCAAGDPDGGLGTSLDLVQRVLGEVSDLAGSAVVLADLGSSVLTVETALELDPSLHGRVRLAPAPFVEGAVAAAVAAQQGADLDAVMAAAVRAARSWDDEASVPGSTAVGSGDEVSVTVRVRNPLGLHARPAAVVARTVADLGVPLTIDGADATSVLALMSLGTEVGQDLTVTARGPEADAALAVVVGLVEGGFGEV